MELASDEKALIRESYAKLVPVSSETSGIFYDNLFSVNPDLRSLFREDLQEQGMKFMSTIGVLVGLLDKPAILHERVRLLGEGHTAFGLTEEDYQNMEEALLLTLSQALRQEFSVEAQSAWRSAFQAISARMIRSGSA